MISDIIRYICIVILILICYTYTLNSISNSENRIEADILVVSSQVQRIETKLIRQGEKYEAFDSSLTKLINEIKKLEKLNDE